MKHYNGSITTITKRIEGQKFQNNYMDDFVCLDIETSNDHNEDVNELHTWLSSAQWLFGNDYRLVRTPEAFVNILNEMIKKYELTMWDRMVIFIHNSSYDLSYLVPYIEAFVTKYADGMTIGSNPFGTILLDNNKFLLYTWGPFEFRCSYKLADMSLEKWSSEMQIAHPKKVGFYDYSKVIYQDDELDANEEDYDYYDVLAMQECLNRMLNYCQTTVAKLPLTATQFVRKELAKSCRKDKGFIKKYFLGTKLTAEQYKMCLMAYSGGYTHCNRFWANKLVKVGETYDYRGKKIKVDKIGHRDFKSHYPSQMTCYPVPIEKFRLAYDFNMRYDITIDDILNGDEFKGYATLTVMLIHEFKLKDSGISMPFWQIAKIVDFDPYLDLCFDIEEEDKDNGRALAGIGDAKVFIEDPQLRILNEQYDIDATILTVYKAKYGMMPECMTSVIDKYFANKSNFKTAKKAAEKQYGKESDEYKEADFECQQSKKRLNGMYGCAATNPLRDIFDLDNNMNFVELWDREKAIKQDAMVTIAEKLDDYYNPQSNHFLPYQWGVWITANARWELYEYIKAVGYDNILYADTDSLFYISTPEIEANIKALNDAKHEVAHYVVLNDGSREYYDYFDLEEYCLAFKGLHSKCYGVVDEKGQLSITIAGVPKNKLVSMRGETPVYYTREQEIAGVPVEYYKDPKYEGMELSDAIVASITDPYGALDNLKDGCTFKVCSGTTGVYIGAQGGNTARVPQTVYLTDKNGITHEIQTAGGCVIREVNEKKVKYNENQLFEQENGQNYH